MTILTYCHTTALLLLLLLCSLPDCASQERRRPAAARRTAAAGLQDAGVAGLGMYRQACVQVGLAGTTWACGLKLNQRPNGSGARCANMRNGLTDR